MPPPLRRPNPYATLIALSVTASAMLFPTSTCEAASVFAGGGVVSEGDDRYKPVALAGVTFGPNVYATAFAYGQRFSIVSRRGQVASLGKQWVLPLPFTKRLSLGIGASFLHESTTLAATSTSTKRSEDSFNLGAHFLFKLRIIDATSFFVDLDWHAHVFPAGFSTLYLVTGRRQVLSLGTGWKWK